LLYVRSKGGVRAWPTGDCECVRCFESRFLSKFIKRERERKEQEKSPSSLFSSSPSLSSAFLCRRRPPLPRLPPSSPQMASVPATQLSENHAERPRKCIAPDGPSGPRRATRAGSPRGRRARQAPLWVCGNTEEEKERARGRGSQEKEREKGCGERTEAEFKNNRGLFSSSFFQTAKCSTSRLLSPAAP